MDVKSFIFRFLIKPSVLIFKNVSIVIIFFIFLIVNTFKPENGIKPSIDPQWIFLSLPTELLKLINSASTVSLLTCLFLVKSLLVVLVGLDLRMIFSYKRKSIINTIKSLRLEYFLWFLKVELFVTIVFSTVALVCFNICKSIYINFGNGYLGEIILISLFLVLFPIYYFNISICSTLSVFPIASNRKISKLKIFYKKRNFFYTYMFYTTRLGIEYVFILALPVVSIIVFNSRIVANIFVLIGLVVPLLLLRGSAYEFKLSILRQDDDVKEIFKDHFKELGYE